MRQVLFAFAVAISVAACLRGNPDYVAPGTTGPGVTSPGPGTSGTLPGPGPGGTDAGVAIDLATPADLAHAPDLAKQIGSDLEGVVCGNQTCYEPKLCCAALSGAGCVDPGLTSCVGGKQIRCDGPEDCGGAERCCGTVTGTECSDSCAWQYTLCHDAGDCDAADHCCPTPNGYGICSKHAC